MQWLLGFWHGKAWENWMGVWWKAGSTGKQRKGWLFWVWRKRSHQAELHWRCLVGRCPTVLFFVVSYLCTNEICQKEQQATGASPLLFAFPLPLPRLPSIKKMLGPCCASASPGVMGQPPTSKNKSGTWNVKVRKNRDRGMHPYFIGFFNSFPSIPWHILCLNMLCCKRKARSWSGSRHKWDLHVLWQLNRGLMGRHRRYMDYWCLSLYGKIVRRRTAFTGYILT